MCYGSKKYRWFCSSFFFFNDTATTEIYTLSLHDALPIFEVSRAGPSFRATSNSTAPDCVRVTPPTFTQGAELTACHAHPCVVSDRKSTRLNSSHANISYAVFCLKKNQTSTPPTYYGRNTR